MKCLNFEEKISQKSLRGILKDLCAVTVYTCLKIYLYKKALFIFVNNVTFFSMLYDGAVEYVANTWICVYMIVK